MFQGQQIDESEKKFKVAFHPLSAEELSRRSGQFAGPQVSLVNLGLEAKHKSYRCGACGQATNGRVVCSLTRKSDGAEILWCLCACDKSEPTILVQRDDVITSQLPLAKDFCSSDTWPPDLARLYDEAAKAYAAGAFTAASMACRKILMSCACHEQEKRGQPPEEGESFGHYVDFIADNVVTMPSAKPAIDAIRKIGNEANHRLDFVTEEDSKRSLKIVRLLLESIYALEKA